MCVCVCVCAAYLTFQALLPVRDDGATSRGIHVRARAREQYGQFIRNKKHSNNGLCRTVYLLPWLCWWCWWRLPEGNNHWWLSLYTLLEQRSVTMMMMERSSVYWTGWEQHRFREDVRGSFLFFASKSGVLLAAEGEGGGQGQTTVVTDCCTRCQTFTVGNFDLKSQPGKTELFGVAFKGVFVCF